MRALKFITRHMDYNPAFNTFSTKFTGFRFELPSWKTYQVQPEKVIHQVQINKKLYGAKEFLLLS